MASPPPLARRAIELARHGDYAEALEVAKQALAQHDDDMGLQLFVGMLHTRRMELAEALPYLRRALAMAPEDVATRVELARVLIGLGKGDEAEVLLDETTARSREGRKLKGTLLMSKGEVEPASALFQSVVDEDPKDFEAWSSLGASLLTAGVGSQAAVALSRSLQLRADRPQVWEKWADAHMAAGTGERALAELVQMSPDFGGDPTLLVTRARLEDLLGRSDDALQSLERALRLDPSHVPAIVASAELLERQNALETFAKMVHRLSEVEPTHEKLPLLQAELAVREGRWDDALILAEAASEAVLAGTRARILGLVHDRRGNSTEAWAAYKRMNDEDRRAFPRAIEEGRRYRTQLRDELKHITAEWYSSWVPVPQPNERPTFLIGFPRSGTTLLDTFLMGDSDVAISEENPLLEEVSRRAGPAPLLAGKDPAEVKELRTLYWKLADKFVANRGERLFVDKLPFALVATPYIERLFAGASILFVERHPCDVVLSCYFTRFHPNGPAASFLDIREAAELYDEMMTYFARCREVLPLRIHDVRYERLVADTESELRGVADFLGLAWTDEFASHRAMAQKRGFIRTPSYAQVVEPVYSRSVARWTRYREQLRDVLPILEPWATRLGYAL